MSFDNLESPYAFLHSRELVRSLPNLLATRKRIERLGVVWHNYLTVTFSVNAPMRQEGSPAFTGDP